MQLVISKYRDLHSHTNFYPQLNHGASGKGATRKTDVMLPHRHRMGWEERRSTCLPEAMEVGRAESAVARVITLPVWLLERCRHSFLACQWTITVVPTPVRIVAHCNAMQGAQNCIDTHLQLRLWVGVVPVEQ